MPTLPKSPSKARNAHPPSYLDRRFSNRRPRCSRVSVLFSGERLSAGRGRELLLPKGRRSEPAMAENNALSPAIPNPILRSCSCHRRDVQLRIPSVGAAFVVVAVCGVVESLRGFWLRFPLRNVSDRIRVDFRALGGV